MSFNAKDMTQGGQIASMRIRDSEIQNFCLHGTVGAGKSEVNVGTACRHPYDTGNVRPFHGGTGLCRGG